MRGPESREVISSAIHRCRRILDFDRSEAFVYHQGQIVLRLADAGAGPLDESSLTNRYLWGSTVDHLLVDEVVSSLAAEGDRSWALGDHLGTIREWADDAGAIENHLIYDSYGNLLGQSNSSAPDHLFGFTGRPYDADTELQNNWNRWYDAAVGRWVSEDPIGFSGGDYNLSIYVHNESHRYLDPTGLSKSNSGPHRPPKIPYAPKGFNRGDMYVVVYVDQPCPGDRNRMEGDGIFEYGHAFVLVIAHDKNGDLRYRFAGFYPSNPLGSLGNPDNPPQPQLGIVVHDNDHYYEVEYRYHATGPGTPTWEDMNKFIDSHHRSETRPYDLDDTNCANFALDVLHKAGHPKLPATFGGVKVTNSSGDSKIVTTPNALGEDILSTFPNNTTGPSGTPPHVTPPKPKPVAPQESFFPTPGLW